MNDNIGLWFVFNDSVLPKEELEKIRIPEMQVAYEVIRIIDRIPLFIEDHYIRLKQTFNLLGFELAISEETLEMNIKKLVQVSRQNNCNVKVIVYLAENKQNYLIYLSKYYYPTNEEVNAGVPTSLLQWERQNPNAKLINSAYKEAVSQKMREENVFEVILVNNDKKITEGSRSNAFFVKGNRVYTAPSEYILKGITRQYVFEACKRAGVEIEERLVGVDELDSMEGVFISGTSIKVLPVSRIDDFVYNSGSHLTIVKIRVQFDSLINEYIGKKS